VDKEVVGVFVRFSPFQLDSLQVELEQANRDNNVESCGGIRTKAETKKH
jgi:hypothetical protein